MISAELTMTQGHVEARIPCYMGLPNNAFWSVMLELEFDASQFFLENGVECFKP
jgi:hypothetical protein